MERGERVAAARGRRYGKAARGERVSTTGRAPASLELRQAVRCPYGLASRTQERDRFWWPSGSP